MYNKYLITGATGFLGRTVVNTLLKQNANVHALVMNNDPLVAELPSEVFITYGDVCDTMSLIKFFSQADDNTCVIHCAGIVSVASNPGTKIYQVNIGGTNNIIHFCEKYNIKKLVHISSVHAIPEKPKGTEITEEAIFSPELVKGHYAKSKAIATKLVFEAANRGLNASIIFPSGIIGPGDIGQGSITNMLLSFIAGKLPLAVKGGYDFVDVRDVANGIILCSEYGEKGHGYILSGQYATIKDILTVANNTLNIKKTVMFLPTRIAKLIAPIYEKISLRKRQTLYFTPYSVAVLESNSLFNKTRAIDKLGYTARSVKESIVDTIKWLKQHK